LKWLKNIFGNKVASEGPAILQLAEINSWLEVREKESDFAIACKEIYGRMEDVAKTFSKDISALVSAGANEDTPPKLLRAGLAARSEVVKQLETLSEKLMPPKKKDPDSAFQHHWALVKGLERTVTTFGRAQSYVAALFPRNIESIKSDLTQISRLLVELETEIGKKRKLAEESWYSRDLAERLQKELSGVDDLLEKTLHNEAALSEITLRLSGLEEEAKRLEASDVGKRAQELKEILEKRKAEKSHAEDELNDLIAPLTKALARMVKQGSSDRIDLQHKNVFEQLSVSPSLVPDKDIDGSLRELQRHLATLGLKDKKKEKVLDHIDLLIKRRSLENARARLQGIVEEIRELESQLKEISREGQRLKEEMSQARKSKKSLEAALDQARNDLSSLEEKAAKDELELEERLARIAGRPIKLDISQGRKCR
jgi:DNA repair exonuclease SbcCD ATPase subunit